MPLNYLSNGRERVILKHIDISYISIMYIIFSVGKMLTKSPSLKWDDLYRSLKSSSIRRGVVLFFSIIVNCYLDMRMKWSRDIRSRPWRQRRNEADKGPGCCWHAELFHADAAVTCICRMMHGGNFPPGVAGIYSSLTCRILISSWQRPGPATDLSGQVSP